MKNSIAPILPGSTALVWFRRDLRSFDHAALYEALKTNSQVYCAFIFDDDILANLPRSDRRVAFIRDCLVELQQDLVDMGGSLLVRHGSAVDEILNLAAQLGVNAVYANHDYEPQAIERDQLVAQKLADQGRSLLTFKDQVIFEKDEVLTQAARPFSVYTPYKNAWMEALHLGDGYFTKAYPVQAYARHFASLDTTSQQLAIAPTDLSFIPTLEQLGFIPSLRAQEVGAAGMSGGQALLDEFIERMGSYDALRDFPALVGPSRLSVHLRFGTVSIRSLVRRALEGMRSGDGRGCSTWLSELIWRDFYFMILYQNPRVIQYSFKEVYDEIVWERGAAADAMFEAWCRGETGYPLVDAAMRQLNQTGYMHNRLRMVTASFLTKDLGLDWRWGEKYFATQLLDYDLSANNGGWQWAASSGCDAQPYFRIFNPTTQSEKFDPECVFIKHYVPELAQLPVKFCHAPTFAPEQVLAQAGVVLGVTYPKQIVQHDIARKETLTRYSVVKKVAEDNPA